MPNAVHKLIDIVPLTLPCLPPSARGLRIAHLTDLHVSRPRRRFRALLRAVEALEADLVLFTGDYMNDAGHEPAAMVVLRDLCRRLHPRLGSYGIFGNHDTHVLRALAAELPVRWLHNEAIAIDDGAIEILGFENEKHHWPDAVKLALQVQAVTARGNGAEPGASSASPPAASSRPLRLLLSHYPTMLPVASELHVDIMFSGHTHGGQWRLPARIALYTSCDLPSRLCAGILRHRDTLAVISRGIGDTFVPMRILCPPQLPVFHLAQGPLPGEHTPHMENVHPW